MKMIKSLKEFIDESLCFENKQQGDFLFNMFSKLDAQQIEDLFTNFPDLEFCEDTFNAYKIKTPDNWVEIFGPIANYFNCKDILIDFEDNEFGLTIDDLELPKRNLDLFLNALKIPFNCFGVIFTDGYSEHVKTTVKCIYIQKQCKDKLTLSLYKEFINVLKNKLEYLEF